MESKKPESINNKSKIKSLEEKSPLEGKYVAINYESEDEHEHINTILIYKIVDGKAKNVFGVLDFPAYQNVSDPTLIDLILKKVKSLKIEEIYQLTKVQDTDLKFLDKSKMFGLEFGGDYEKVNEATNEAEDRSETSPWIKSDEILRDLEESGVKIKTFDVRNQKILE